MTLAEWRNRAAEWGGRPLVLLGVLTALSTAIRCVHLDLPNMLMFDEDYYVNAARDMVGHHSTASSLPLLGQGIDSNPAHPPLAKLLIGGGISLFGDNPVGWRTPSVVFGTLAILLTYWVVRSAGGRPAMALTASTLMAVDNLVFIHGRMATLDIFVLVFMLAAVGLYLRRLWAPAGIAVGVGACTKLVAFDVLLVVGLIEVGRLILTRALSGRASGWPVRSALIALGGCAGVTLVAYLGTLGLLDHFVGRDPNPLSHTSFMLHALSTPGTRFAAGPIPVSADSLPWQWLIDQVPINYWRQVGPDGDVINFRGMMTPAIIFATVPALVLCGRSFWREHDQPAMLALAWFAGTMIPFVLGALQHRTTYIYYFLIVMPSVCVAVARCFWGRPRLPDTLRAAYVLAVAYGFIALFPFRTLSGR
ncbi:MAG: phospholipid carrier-dependent glycosyltransferase [Candidatus Dormibacteria bacterium]